MEAIGFDFGLTKLCVAYHDGDKVKLLQDSETQTKTPTVVFKNSPNNAKQAQQMAIVSPESAVFEINTTLGPDTTYTEHSGEFVKRNLTEVCATVLDGVKLQLIGHFVDKAVITVPVKFNANQRKAIISAATEAGFTVMKLLDKPVAAALCFYYDRECDSEEYSLVYYLGGGSFSVAIVKRNLKDIDVIAVDGDCTLGGQNFDDLIVQHVCEELTNFSVKTDPRSMRRLHRVCEEAKKILSIMEETTIILDAFVEGYSIVEVTLKRTHFEILAHNLFEKTIRMVDRCLKDHNLSKDTISEVVISGGSTRIPKVQQLLSGYFGGKPLNSPLNSEECVAKGAAVQAAMLFKQIPSLKMPDVTSLSLGIRGLGNKMNFVIKRNTPIPATVSEVFSNVHDRQDVMSFVICEGERLNATKNDRLGELKIRNLTPAGPNQCQVTLTMTVNVDGSLTVVVKENSTDNVEKLVIPCTRGCRSTSEIKHILKDAEQHRQEDQDFVYFSQQKMYLLNSCVEMLYHLEHKNLVDEYEDIYDFCYETFCEAEQMNIEEEDTILNMIEEIEELTDELIATW